MLNIPTPLPLTAETLKVVAAAQVVTAAQSEGIDICEVFVFFIQTYITEVFASGTQNQISGDLCGDTSIRAVITKQLRVVISAFLYCIPSV